MGAFTGKRRSLLAGESCEWQGHKQNDLSKPEACVIWDVSGQLPSRPLEPGVSHLLPWLPCPSPTLVSPLSLHSFLHDWPRQPNPAPLLCFVLCKL